MGILPDIVYLLWPVKILSTTTPRSFTHFCNIADKKFQLTSPASSSQKAMDWHLDVLILNPLVVAHWASKLVWLLTGMAMTLSPTTKQSCSKCLDQSVELYNASLYLLWMFHSFRLHLSPILHLIPCLKEINACLYTCMIFPASSTTVSCNANASA